MEHHWHGSIDNIVFIVIVALVGRKLVQIGAAHMAGSSMPPVAHIGTAIGSVAQ